MAKGKKRKRGDRTGAACHVCAGSHTSSDCPTLDEDGEGGAGPAARKRGRKGRWTGGSFRSFAAARAFARGLGLTSMRAWQAWCKGGARPADIPSSPNQVYKGKGWAGYGDWLGCQPDNDEECPCCLDPLPGKGRFARIPGCGHRFHRRCVNQLRRAGHTQCPMCRGPLG